MQGAKGKEGKGEEASVTWNLVIISMYLWRCNVCTAGVIGFVIYVDFFVLMSFFIFIFF